MIPVTVAGKQKTYRSRPAERVEHALDRRGIGPMRVARECITAAPTIELFAWNASDVAVGQDTQRAQLVVDVGDRHPRDGNVVRAGGLRPRLRRSGPGMQATTTQHATERLTVASLEAGRVATIDQIGNIALRIEPQHRGTEDTEGTRARMGSVLAASILSATIGLFRMLRRCRVRPLCRARFTDDRTASWSSRRIAACPRRSSIRIS